MNLARCRFKQITAARHLREATASLAQATEVLRPASERMASDLLPGITALAEQVALLATEAKDSELEAATFTELTRLGTTVDNLRALLTFTEDEATQLEQRDDYPSEAAVEEPEANA